MRRFFWLFTIVSSFKNSSKRFLFVNWFMLFLRFWSNVADSLKRRFLNDLSTFRFVLFFIQVNVSLKVEMNERIIVVETFFVLIAWNMNFVFAASLILFFFAYLLKHWWSNALWNSLQKPHFHFNAFFWWEHSAKRCFCAQCAQHCLFLQKYVQWL